MSKIINSIIVIGSLLGSSSFLGAQETLQEVNREFSRINQQMSRLDSVEVEFAKFTVQPKYLLRFGGNNLLLKERTF